MTANLPPFADDGRDRSWMPQAACRGMEANVWFPLRGENNREPKAVCAGCPVIAACREYGMDEHYGLWGGLSEKERVRARRRQPRTGAA